MRAYFSLRLYLVITAFLVVVVTASFFASPSGDSVAFGPYMSKEPHLDPILSHEGGRDPERQCPDRPWLTGNPNVNDDISETNCRFRQNWTCRTQESNDEPVGELCMWSDCTKCWGCTHLDSDDSHYAMAYHWDDCCYMTGDPPVCVSGYCIYSNHQHSPSSHGHPHDELDYCAPCVNWRWRVEGRPSYSTYRDQLGRLMSFDEYIKAGAETTLQRRLGKVDAVDISLFLAGVPHYDVPVRERSPYYLTPPVPLSSLPAAWNVESGESHLPMHTGWLPDTRYPAGTYDFYALDPRDRGVYPDALASPGPGAGAVVSAPLHMDVLVDPAYFSFGHISSSATYKFDPICPYMDPSVGVEVPTLSCPGPDFYYIEITGAEMIGLIRQALGSIPSASLTESRVTWEVAELMGLTNGGSGENSVVRHDVSKLQHDFIRPGFQILPDSAFATPRAAARPASTPAWIYSWPTATPDLTRGPNATPRLAGSVDDPALPDYNTRVHTGKAVIGLRVMTSGGELCQPHTKALVLDWHFLDGALFYEVEAWDMDTGVKVQRVRSYTTRAYINYLELSPCDGTDPVTYELVVRAYDYTGELGDPDGQHRSANVSRFDTNVPLGGNDGGANAITHTMPTAPVNDPCVDPSPCFCPVVSMCPP